MIKNNKILIIVPTLNCSKLIEALIVSIKSQNYLSWRIIFVDGNSDYKNLEVLKKISEHDQRISLVQQTNDREGIFGAMSQGFGLAKEDEWILFWGSDDFAKNSKVLFEINADINSIQERSSNLDLIIYGAQYINLTSKREGRKSIFTNLNKKLNAEQYTSHLLFGCAPPHQGCVFSPKLQKRRNYYEKDFELSADLDYFLQLSKFEDLSIYCSNRVIVMLGDDGISGKKTKKRLLEVKKAYKRRFGKKWIYPVFLRYVRRIFSLIK